MPQTDHDRLRAVVDAAIAVTSELSIEAVLQRIVEAAADLTGARYAALGVIDQSGTGLESFVHRRVDRAATKDGGHRRPLTRSPSGGFARAF